MWVVKEVKEFSESRLIFNEVINHESQGLTFYGAPGMQ